MVLPRLPGWGVQAEWEQGAVMLGRTPCEVASHVSQTVCACANRDLWEHRHLNDHSGGQKAAGFHMTFTFFFKVLYIVRFPYINHIAFI